MFTETRQRSPILITSAICLGLAGMFFAGCNRPAEDSTSSAPTVLATDVAFPGVNSVQPLLRPGKVRALAVTTRRKSTVLPESR